jgi:hypothetical protein
MIQICDRFKGLEKQNFNITDYIILIYITNTYIYMRIIDNLLTI